MYTSYDLKLDYDDGWVAVVNTGTKIALTVVASGPSVTDVKVRVRFGISSDSAGFNMRVDDTVIVDSTVYLKVATGMQNNVFVNVVVVS
mgnify:CR=1 FL=1